MYEAPTHDTSSNDDIIADLFSQRCADDPVTVYHEVHEQCPVHRAAGMFGGHSVHVAGYADVLWALKHPEVFSSKDVVNIGNDVPLIPLSVDPPDHAKYRRLLDPEFSPKKMAALEPEARVLVNEIIDRFANSGACEFHEDFATPLPSTIFLALVGLPQSDLGDFLRWRDDTIRPVAATAEETEQKRMAAGRAINDYFVAALEEKRVHPDDRLLSRIGTGEVDGRPLTQSEKLGICHLLLLGGLDTVTATLDCMIAYLAQHQDRRQAIVDDPELMSPAIEEMLRQQTPVMMVPRVIAQDYELGGVKMSAGDSATLMIGAANCDEAEFDSSADVMLDRGANRHLAFGGGAHRCLGSHLARMELRVALEEFHKRIPEYNIVDGTEIHFSAGIRQADHLPLVFPVHA
ncbi:MAG: cytochrome P450 [Acidimicrobiia bacterium]